MIENRVNCALFAHLIVVASLIVAGSAMADLPPEDIGISEVLPEQTPVHWVWVVDAGSSFSRALLFDGDTGTMKGQLDTGYWSPGLALSADRKSIFSNETYFAHGTRGTRTDIVAIYDADTLLPRAEIPVPPRRMTALSMRHMTGLTDNQVFLGVTNFTPTRTLSLVDVKTGTLVSEKDTPGCGQVYPAGDNRLMTLCGDGSFLTFTMEQDEAGSTRIIRSRSAAFFDPQDDPVIISAARRDDHWYFSSFNGFIHEVDASTPSPVLEQKWSLLSDKERRKDWRTSGFQSLALHTSSGLLFTLMHRGGPETYEEPGEEVWIYDSETQSRLSRIKLKHPAVSIEVTRDDAPLLFASAFDTVVPTWMLYTLGLTGRLGDINAYLKPVVDVYDARTGEYLRTIEGTGTFPVELHVP